jgi:hypothetical protein
MGIFKKKPQNEGNNEEGLTINPISYGLRKRVKNEEYDPEYKPLSLSDKYGPYEYPGETGKSKKYHGIRKRTDV